MWMTWMPEEASASWLGFGSKWGLPKAVMWSGPLIPLALTAFSIAGATFEASTSSGTAQLWKSHHTETLTSREWLGAEVEEDEEEKDEWDDENSHAWSRSRSVGAGERERKRWSRRRALIGWITRKERVAVAVTPCLQVKNRVITELKPLHFLFFTNHVMGKLDPHYTPKSAYLKLKFSFSSFEY